MYRLQKETIKNTYQKLKCSQKGIIVADMDLTIDGIALANSEKLISHNLKQFSTIETLELESWVIDN